MNTEPPATPNGASEPPLVRSSSRREIEFTLFIVALLSFAYFYQASDHSVACRIDLIRSLLERHTLWIDGYAGYNTADILQYKGHIFPAKAPGTSFAAIPSWLVARVLLAPLAFVLREGTYWALATYLTTLLSLSLIVAFLTVLMYRSAILFGIGEGRAVAVALILAFATVMFPYGTEFTGEPMAAACAFAAFYLLFLPPDTTSKWRGVGAGFLAGWSVLCDFTAVLLAGAIAVYALLRLRRVRPIAAFGLGVLAVVSILLVHNELAFGKSFFVSYEGLALPGTEFPEHQVGFLGITTFNQAVLWKVLFLPQRGLFFCNPVLLLAFPGLLFWWRRGRALRPELALTAFAILSFLILNGCFVDAIRIWGGGTSVGPRHLIPIVPFLVLALAFLPAAFDYPLALLALVSAAFMLMTTAVDPHLPYEYDQPMRDFLWPAYLRGDLALNRDPFFGGLPVAGDSVAFNLGKLVGLPGVLQLLPLLAFWMTMGWRLVHRLHVWANRRLPRFAFAAALIAMFAPPTLGALVARPDLSQASGLLGRYYEGLHPETFPPHIVRVDPKLDFNSITEMGSLPSPSCVLWSGQIYAPKNGLYYFDLQTPDTDDAVWLTIDGQPVVADPGSTTQVKRDGGTFLSAGWHRIELGDRHLWGGVELHLLWRPPGMVSELIPTSNLKPTPAPTT